MEGNKPMICTLCPRMCRAQRDETHGEGNCGMGTRAVVARAAPHYWEEACLSGTRGCGTIFFSGCPLGCVYCQNYEISHEKQGRPVTDEELVEVLHAKGYNVARRTVAKYRDQLNIPIARLRKEL